MGFFLGGNVYVGSCRAAARAFGAGRLIALIWRGCT